METQRITTTNGKITVTVKEENKENRNIGYREIDFSLDELPGNIIELSSALYGCDYITISEDYITTCAAEAACDTPPIYIENKYQILPSDTIARAVETYLWKLIYLWSNNKLLVTIKPKEE